MIRIKEGTREQMTPEIVSQKVLKVIKDDSAGQWQETWEEWQFKWGEEEGTFVIKLVPAADGGVDFSIIPKHIAEDQGMVSGTPKEEPRATSEKSKVSE